MNSDQKKQRGDAVLKNMGDRLMEEFFQVLRTTTQDAALAWLLKEHGIKSSTRACSEFFVWYPRQGRLKQIANFAHDLETTIKKLPELKITAEQASDVAQVAFEIRAAQDNDAELFLALKKDRREAKKISLDERRIQLLERKAAQADEAQKITNDSSLSDEEKAQQMRSLFGMG